MLASIFIVLTIEDTDLLICFKYDQFINVKKYVLMNIILKVGLHGSLQAVFSC